MKDPSSIAIYRYLVSVDLLWIFYPSRRQDSGIQHGPTQVSSLQTVWLCDMLCHRPPEERVDQASLQFLKEETSSTSVNCKTTSPDYVLPPPPSWPRHCSKMGQGRKGGKEQETWRGPQVSSLVFEQQLKTVRVIHLWKGRWEALYAFKCLNEKETCLKDAGGGGSSSVSQT